MIGTIAESAQPQGRNNNLSSMAKKDSRTYHVLRFLETEFNGSLAILGGFIRFIITAMLSLTKNKKLKATLRFSAAAIPAGLMTADVIMKVKKYRHTVKTENEGVSTHRNIKCRTLLGLQYDDINEISPCIEHEVCSWLLSSPKTSTIKIIDYYDFNTMDKKREGEEIFVVLESTRKFGIIIKACKGFLSDSSYFEGSLVINTWNNDLIQDVMSSIMADYIHSLNTTENVIQFGYFCSLKTVKRSNIPETIMQFDVDALAKEIRIVLKSLRKRTYLFVGVPGTGKSSILKKIEHIITEYPVIHLRSCDFENPEAIANRFKIIRSVQPAIVMIEDVDSLDFDERGRRTAMMLDCIDDVANKLNFVLLMTANDTSLLHYSFVDRPGRVDVVRHIHPPQCVDEAYAVLNSKLVRLKTAYCNNGFKLPDIKILQPILSKCIEKKFTQADIGNGILEQAMIEMSNGGDFENHFTTAFDKHLKTKTAIKECSFSNTKPDLEQEEKPCAGN